MKRIKLSQGKTALVDDSDFESVSKFKWHANKCAGGGWYARRAVYNPINKRTTHVYLHRQIMGFPKQGVDHRDGNRLNNQRKNLRLAKQSQNSRNSKLRKNSSGFKGVCLLRQTGRFIATITVNRRNIHLGYFDEKVDAAKAYDSAAIKNFGRFAKTNHSLGLL